MDFTEERIFEVGHGKIKKNSPGRKVGGRGDCISGRKKSTSMELEEWKR